MHLSAEQTPGKYNEKMIRKRSFSGDFQILSQEIANAKILCEKGYYQQAIELLKNLRIDFFGLDDKTIYRIQKQGWSDFLNSSELGEEALQVLVSLLVQEGTFEFKYGKNERKGRSYLISAKELLEVNVNLDTFNWGELRLLKQIHALLKIS
ncbi:hypothetical protein [Bacteroidetes bacterium endosymbiont of Geopemphigus sp.]|uniref:hypothetical protein n=1 Tax=Bacteroidetes bacterium endosymbiont of Geopemphigus sp. TaxID=2047937 RepID=UPI000CD2BA46|nr:hypothetical protein [Bacteroidetes bacterium endosymbiont of Geopemphigus sp.]